MATEMVKSHSIHAPHLKRLRHVSSYIDAHQAEAILGCIPKVREKADWMAIDSDSE